MNWTNWLTLGIAVLGATLGVFNTWTNYRRGTRRARIQCGYDKSQGTEAPSLWCEVINPGGVPVTIKSVRVLAARGDLTKEMPIHGSADIERKLLGRLEPGASVVATAPADYVPFFLWVTKVTATTADGLECVLLGRRLERVQAELRKALPGADVLLVTLPEPAGSPSVEDERQD
ncbi:hypothetical protein [Stenotrophomonas maltophilia]|uniref:hypothetical protein n=1 Tax=Stenotrophomonas maltophilia TaxID=40324 RepID=UPI0013D9FAAB|nr:hypothetical protein [Stenotrophomonas maltophilia]